MLTTRAMDQMNDEVSHAREMEERPGCPTFRNALGTRLVFTIEAGTDMPESDHNETLIVARSFRIIPATSFRDYATIKLYSVGRHLREEPQPFLAIGRMRISSCALQPHLGRTTSAVFDRM
jgi:hypothetical protein